MFFSKTGFLMLPGEGEMPSRHTTQMLWYARVRSSVLIIENRIYILEGNLLEKSVKGPFCCSVSILQVYFTYLCYITFWALEYHFIENLKLMLKKIKL